MNRDQAELAEKLRDKYTPRFAAHLRINPDLDTRLRCLLELVVSEAMFAGRWGDVVGENVPHAPSPQMGLAFDEEPTLVR
jgi:hypothetical protein